MIDSIIYDIKNYARKIKWKIETKIYKNFGIGFFKKGISRQFKKALGYELDWNNLHTYNEKMQYAKLYESSPIKAKLTDKYLVRHWVKELIGEKYLIPLLGVWRDVEEINFEELPNQFVLKTTNGSSTNIIIKDKSRMDKSAIKKKLKLWMNYNLAYNGGYQMHYKDLEPKIIAEKYTVDSRAQLNDYKFLCFNGNVHYCWVDVGRYENHRRNIYNLDWELQTWNQHHYPNYEGDIPKPNNFEEMVNIAKKLSHGFSHVRVDLYNVDGIIYFGEMTFTNGNGFEKISPYEANLHLGQLWKLNANEGTYDQTNI